MRATHSSLGMPGPKAQDISIESSQYTHHPRASMITVYNHGAVQKRRFCRMCSASIDQAYSFHPRIAIFRA